jgi:hypothetical protein
MVEYKIRGIPREVDRELRRKARDRKISLNRLLVEELTRASRATGRRYRSVRSIAGTWKEDPAFDLAVERVIDWNIWR